MFQTIVSKDQHLVHLQSTSTRKVILKLTRRALNNMHNYSITYDKEESISQFHFHKNHPVPLTLFSGMSYLLILCDITFL